MKRLISTVVAGVIAWTGCIPDRVYAASVMLHIPQSYATVRAGESVYFEIEFLYPENRRRQDVTITYAIQREGEVIAQADFLKAIETQASFMDSVPVPDTASAGTYSMHVRIVDDTGAVVAKDVSTTFVVTRGHDAPRTYFLVLLSAVVVVGVSVLLEVRGLRRAIERTGIRP